jgi:membrane protease YdiL (CAAX protease family)
MLSEKPWKEESVLRLILVLLCCFVGVSMLALVIGKLAGRPATAEPRPLDLALGAISMQSAALIAVHFFLREHGVGWSEFLGVSGRRMGRALLSAIAVSLASLPAALLWNLASAWTMQLIHVEPEMQTSIKMVKASPGVGQLSYLAVVTMVSAPFIEETIFRGVLYPAVKRLGYPKAALVGTSLAFAALHGNLMSFVPLAILGIVWALLYEVTDTLLAPMLAHSVFNAVNFLWVIYEVDPLRLFKFLQ